jgi:hypothetical protein
LSRFRILAVFATLAALTIVLAACGGGESDDPQAIVENATLEGVESGVLDVSLHVTSSGSEGGNLTASLSGPFQSEGSGNLPKLDIDFSAKGEAQGEKVDFAGGLILLNDRAFIDYKGTEYEVDPTTFGFVKSALEQAEDGSEDNAADPSACQEAVSGLELDEFVEGLKDEGSVDVDGTSTTKVTGDLKADSAIDALIKLIEDPACSAQLEAAGPLPLDELEEAKSELSSALKKTHVELYVGDDDIIRKAAAEFTIAPKDSDGTIAVDLELSLGEVNEPQSIQAPSGALTPLEVLFRKLGVNPLELLERATTGEGLGELLEELNSASKGGGGGSGGGTSGGGSEEEAAPPTSGNSSQQAYLDCLKQAETPVDLQNCASLLK